MQLQQQLVGLQGELAYLKEQMVAKSQFASLEQRVLQLEQRGAPAFDTSSLQNMVSRLDPCEGQCSFSGI